MHNWRKLRDSEEKQSAVQKVRHKTQHGERKQPNSFGRFLKRSSGNELA